jgi:hypothetical protein
MFMGVGGTKGGRKDTEKNGPASLRAEDYVWLKAEAAKPRRILAVWALKLR